MAKESQKLDELNTESTEEKTIQKDGDEQINDISTKDDEKIETVVNESSDLSNKNIETETVDVIKNVNQTTDEVKKSSDDSESQNKEKDFQFQEEITYTSEEIEDLTKTYSETLPVIEDKQHPKQYLGWV